MRADRLSPRQLADLVNAARPGTITERQIRYQVQTSKHTLGRGGRIHLLLYIAWLRRLLLDGQKLKHKDQRTQAEVMHERRAAGRDIGEIPEVKNPERRESCRRDLAKFFRTYMPATFPLPFSADHLRVIKKLEAAILDGGLFVEAVYRGFGKTTIAWSAAIWAALYGHKKFVPLIAADKKAATDELIAPIQGELENNDLLMDDFPKACFPVRKLEGIAHRCPGQTHGGERTRVELLADAMVLPTIPGSESSGVVIRAYGLTGRIRGLQFKLTNGRVVRPDFVIIDDPQTDQSAASLSQCETRERLIVRAVLGLAGHTQRMSAVMPSTVIRKGDLVDRLLDRKLHPEWQGDKMPMFRKFADRHDDLWLGEYAELRRQDTANAGAGEPTNLAAEFYHLRRAEMDAGAEISWEHCKTPDETSAIQHGYNLLIDRKERAFMAEYQLEPLDEYERLEKPMEPREIMAKVNRLPRYTAGHGASVITAFVDCHSAKNVFWKVCWFGDGFSGGLMDRGSAPVVRGRLGGVEAALTETLGKIVNAICGRSYPVAGGGELRMSLCLIDSGWQAQTVYAFCRQSQHAAVLAPSKGQGGELDLRAPRLCARRDQGDGWYHALTVRRDARLLMYDTDRFKSFTYERLRTPMGGRGGFSLWGATPGEHYTDAMHLTSERSEAKTKKGGDVFGKWSVMPGRENHGWDCLVGCHVAAAKLGIALDETGGGRIVAHTKSGGKSWSGRRVRR